MPQSGTECPQLASVHSKRRKLVQCVAISREGGDHRGEGVSQVVDHFDYRPNVDCITLARAVWYARLSTHGL